LRSKGYAVDLAGVRSAAAANASGYDVIVTGGPVYAGMVSGSIASYLKALTPSKDARIGAFATGQDADIRSDPAALKREVAPLPENSPFTPVAVVKIVSNEEADTMCAAFVDELLK
jgi:menaquinone-dependent protoporphyrinogen IX oxidase